MASDTPAATLGRPSLAGTPILGLGRIRVAGKLMVLTVVLATAIAAQIAFTVDALRSQEADAAQADALGRQRFLILRYFADAMQAAGGLPNPYEASKQIFDRNLAAMLSGGVVTIDVETGRTVIMPPPETPQIAAQLRAQEAAAQRLDDALERFMRLPPDLRADPELQGELRELRMAVSSAADGAARLFTEHARQQVQSVILLEIVVGALAILVAGGVAWLVGRSIVLPLREAVAMARRIADGDLRQDPIPVRSRDEVGELLGAFNEMLSSLRAITSESRGAANRLASAVAEIMASIQEQAASAREQAAAVQEITTTVEEINQSAQQVSDMSRQVGSAADEVAAAGQSGVVAVRDASAAMDAIRSQTESVAETIVALSERTQAIGEIIASVNEIAEQSNLVALNAAIEAADAGDQGRRFSVVANEIKVLSDQAKEATKQVRSILEQTQKNINASVMLTEEALKRVSSGHEKAQTAEQAIHRMAGNIEENSSSFQQVVAATGQQQIGLEQITQGLQQIREASVQTATGTDQLAKASADLSQLGQALTRLMEKYRL